MESPDSWGEAEYTVDRVLIQHDQSIRDGMSGASLAMQICDALRARSLLQVKETDRDE